MDSISLHLEIENSLNETLKQTQILMKSFNSALELSSKNMGAIEKTAKSTAVHYDDLEEASEKISKSTFNWKSALSGVRTTLSYIIPSVAAVFSVAGILEAGKAALDFNTQLKNLSFRMGEGAKDTTTMRKALFGMVRDTGVAQENALALITTLRSARIAAKDMRELGTATVQFSAITGTTAEQAAKLGSELIRTGGLSIEASKDMMTSMARIQRRVGMTAAEMDNLADTVIENTKWLGQMDKSSGFIEDFNKGTIKLAGAFRQVGIEVSEVGQLMDRLLDPGRIEENALLYAKLGISMQDALSGDLDPAMMTEKLKGLGEELKGMGGPAAAALAGALGMPLKQLRQMADIDMSELGETGGNLGSMFKEQQSVGEGIQRTMNKVQGEMTNAFSGVVEKIDQGMTALKKMPFMKKTFWIGIVLLAIGVFTLLFRSLRKKFFALASDFGDALTTATSEAITMGQQKASIVSSKRQGRTGRGEARRQRVEAGPGFEQMEETANYFDVLADSDLFPAIKNMSKNTADWLRKIALGSKGVSLLGQITQENNQAIKDRIGMYNNEQAILTNTLDLTIQRKNEEELILMERHDYLTSLVDENNKSTMTARQQKEMRLVSRDLIKLENQGFKLSEKRQSIEDRFEKSKRRQINLLEPQAQKQLFEAIQGKIEENKKLLFGGELRKSELDIQKEALQTQMAILRTEINYSATSGATAETMLRQNKQLKEMEVLSSEVSGESNELNMNMANARKEITLSNNEMVQLEKATNKTADQLSNIDVSRRSGFLTRMSRAVSTTLNKAGSNFRDAFKSARESSLAIGKNIMAKFNPVNWLKSLRARARGFTDTESRKSRSSMSGLSKTFKGVGKIIGKMGFAIAILGIVMKLLAPVFKQLQPVIQTLIDALKPIAETIIRKLVPPLLRFFRDMIPLLASLINMLLPPLLKVLGFLLKVIGTLLEVMGGLIKGMGEMGRSIEASFSTKGKIRSKVLGDVDTVERVRLTMQEHARERITTEMAKTYLQNADDIKNVYKEFGQGPVGKVLDKVGDFVVGFGVELQKTGDKMSELGDYFAANPAIDEEAQKAIMAALGTTADKMETFSLSDSGTTVVTPDGTSSAGAQAARLRASGGRINVEQEAQMEILNNEEITAEATTRGAEAGEVAAEEAKKQTDRLDTLITTMTNLTGTMNRWMNNGGTTPIGNR